MKTLMMIFASLLSLGYAQTQDGQTQDITLNFAAHVGDEVAACGTTYAGIGSTDAAIEFADLRFYVSNVQLLTEAGEAVALELLQDNTWQVDNVALLDFEDATGACNGNPAVNSQIIGSVPAGTYTGIRFDLGVPQTLNHLDTATAPAPLNVTPMWWNWRGGYKFLRVDLVVPASENPGYPMHLGSTGCRGDVAVLPPTEPCMRPNVVTVQFAAFDASQDTIIADIAALFAASNVAQSLELAPPGCMSGPTDPDCDGLFTQGLGLSRDSGTCPNGACEQQLFRLE